MSTVNANMIWKSKYITTVFIRQFQCIVGLKRSNWKNNCLSRFECYQLFHDGGPYHIDTSFYMIGTSVMKGLIMVNQAHANNSMFIFANIDTGSNAWNLFKVSDKNNSGRCGFFINLESHLLRPRTNILYLYFRHLLHKISWSKSK